MASLTRCAVKWVAIMADDGDEVAWERGLGRWVSRSPRHLEALILAIGARAELTGVYPFGRKPH